MSVRGTRCPMNKANGQKDERPLIERALRWTEGFSRWPEHCLSELSAAAELRRYERGDLIASPDGEVRVVLAVISGYMLARRIDAVGARSSFDVIGPGQVVEMTPALGVQDNSEFDYVAHSDAVIVHIPASALMRVLDTDPALWKDALRMALLREQPGARGRLAIHEFIEAMRALQPALRQVAEALFESHGRGSRGPRWRGLYVTAAASGAAGGAFVTDLFERFLPADQPLARPGRAPNASAAKA